MLEVVIHLRFPNNSLRTTRRGDHTGYAVVVLWIVYCEVFLLKTNVCVLRFFFFVASSLYTDILASTRTCRCSPQRLLAQTCSSPHAHCSLKFTQRTNANDLMAFANREHDAFLRLYVFAPSLMLRPPSITTVITIFVSPEVWLCFFTSG